MAGATVRMQAKKQKTLQEIHEKIHYIVDAEQISKSVDTVNDVTIWTLAYEKYYLRTGSYTSLTVVLTEYGEEQRACIVASGGGAGMVNHSFGANRNFAKACVKVLEDCGFEVVESDLKMKDKGFLEKIFK